MRAFTWIRACIVAAGVGSAAMVIAVADPSVLTRSSSVSESNRVRIDEPAAATEPAVRISSTATPALDVLATIIVADEHQGGYDRDLFDYPAEIDNGCDTRNVVLIRDSITPTQLDPTGCAVVAGDWYSTYDNITWSDPGEIEIDHVLALKEAWDSGAWAWSPDRRRDFANDVDDPRMLRAVTASVNQTKSAADPSNWLPPYEPFVCQYVADWVHIKATWALTMDRSEYGRVRNVLTERCPDQLID